MTPRIGTVPKAIALVPLAALSAAWTVQVVRAPEGEVAVVSGASASARPTPTTAPTVPAAPAPLVVPPGTDAPGSVWGDPGAGAPAPAAASPAVVPAAVVPAAIPSAALAAYQRAATVMSTADPTCHLDWTLLAGIGRVESDHGSHGGSRLGDDGRVTPGIIGPALTGLGGTLLVADTDGGALDGDTGFDHAVGPMQFLPGTWSVVGVDGDGDGQRDPQDVDDAALAAGVYLCSGPEDLATPAGQQAALLRYNHSTSYVVTVLRFAADYATGLGAASGDAFARSVGLAPGVVPGVVLAPADATAATGGKKRPKRHPHPTQDAGSPVQTSGGGGAGHHGPATQVAGTPDPSTTGTPHLEPLPPATETELRDQVCTPERIRATYPQATDPAVLEAIDLCVQELSGQPLSEAHAHVEALVDGLRGRDGLEGLEGPSEPPADGSGEQPGTPPSQEPSREPSQEPSQEPSATPSGAAGSSSGASASATTAG